MTEPEHILTQNRIGVKVKCINKKTKTYQITNDISIIPKGTRLSERSNHKIVDNENNEITPTGRFLWTIETIDPYHLVTDMFL